MEIHVQDVNRHVKHAQDQIHVKHAQKVITLIQIINVLNVAKIVRNVIALLAPNALTDIFWMPMDNVQLNALLPVVPVKVQQLTVLHVQLAIILIQTIISVLIVLLVVQAVQAVIHAQLA